MMPGDFFKRPIGLALLRAQLVLRGGVAPGLPGRNRTILGIAACLLFGASSLAAQGEQIFKGQICLGPEGRTPTIENGQARLPCTIAHPKRNARYILFNPEDKTTYYVETHSKAKPFAGRDVVVIGTLDSATGTIHIDELYRALPRKIVQATSVYIECDACPRGMAAAWRAAFEELSDWGRFDINPDPKKADLIFLFSANPYLGDYITRDGPDKRGVAVDITYMNVVDPQTGENLWGDSRQWGSLFVAKATKALINELRLRLEEESQTSQQAAQGNHRGRPSSPSGNN
jgi:hypothetical protein